MSNPIKTISYQPLDGSEKKSYRLGSNAQDVTVYYEDEEKTKAVSDEKITTEYSRNLGDALNNLSVEANDSKITLQTSAGNEIGNFTLNQENNSTINGFSEIARTGSYSDLTVKPAYLTESFTISITDWYYNSSKNLYYYTGVIMDGGLSNYLTNVYVDKDTYEAGVLVEEVERLSVGFRLYAKTPVVVTIKKAVTAVKELAITEGIVTTSEGKQSGGGSVSWDQIYPIGSIYMNVTNTSPNTLFEGTTWTALAPGRMLLGAGTGVDANNVSKTFSEGDSGGEYTHTLTEAEMPKHTHTFTGEEHSHSFTPTVHSHSATPTDNIRGISYNAAAGNGGPGYGGGVIGISIGNARAGGTISNASTNGTNANTGGSAAHNNLPPYLAVYMWQRTA